MRLQWIKALLGRAGEIVLSTVLVLGCFLLFFALLGLVFPSGTSLGELIRSREALEGLATERELDFGRTAERAAPNDSRSAPDPRVVAELTHVRRRVQHKATDRVVWSPARVGLQLGNRHAVKTAERSGAVVTFDPRNRLEIGENALVVIKRLEAIDGIRERASLVVRSGALSGRMVRTARREVQVEVATPSGTAKLQSAAAATDATDFKVAVEPDRATTYMVYQGTAEVENQGRSVAVGANQAVTVPHQGQPGPVVSLPPAPRLTAPAYDQAVLSRSATARVSLRWSAVAGADGYLVALAADPSFERLVYRGIQPDTELVHGGLEYGTYHWRVATLIGQAQGAPAESRFTVVRDDRPPELRVEFPQQVITQPTLLLRGRTDPDVELSVDGVPVALSPQGEFEHLVQLQPGTNLIVVEALDAAGNSSYQSAMVHASY